MRGILAKSMPVVLSGMSGMSGQEKQNPGQCEPPVIKALRESVRDVRADFYSLTHARARVAVKESSGVVCINPLIYSFFPGHPGQRKKVIGIIDIFLVRSTEIIPGHPGHPGQGEAR